MRASACSPTCSVDQRSAPGPDPSWHVLLAGTRGFCAGVRRAVETVERALAVYGPPVYVRHEIVHNAAVVARLTALGARFVAAAEQAPPGSVLLLSAHGVAPDIERDAARHGRRVIDATCPLVKKVHLEAERLVRQGFEVVMIGHAGHPEVEGTLGRIGPGAHLVASAEEVGRLQVRDTRRVAYVSQTTLSVEDVRGIAAALLVRYPQMLGAEQGHVCYATQNRQDAVRDLAAAGVDVVIVAGAANSSNANRLREVAERCGRPSRLVAGPSELDPAWLSAARRIGVTAAASTPDSTTHALIEQLRRWRPVTVSALPAVAEPYRFRLPDPFDADTPQ